MCVRQVCTHYAFLMSYTSMNRRTKIHFLWLTTQDVGERIGYVNSFNRTALTEIITEDDSALPVTSMALPDKRWSGSGREDTQGPASKVPHYNAENMKWDQG